MGYYKCQNKHFIKIPVIAENAAKKQNRILKCSICGNAILEKIDEQTWRKNTGRIQKKHKTKAKAKFDYEPRQKFRHEQAEMVESKHKYKPERYPWGGRRGGNKK